MKNKAQNGRRKYSEIADTALKLFLENGYEATSMRMIASGVGCEPGLIYYYFRNKDEAFEKAFERLFDGFTGHRSSERLSEGAVCRALPALPGLFKRSCAFSLGIRRAAPLDGKRSNKRARAFGSVPKGV